MKKKDVTVRDIEQNSKDWKSVPSEKRIHVDHLLERVMASEKEKKEAKFTARLSQSDFEGLKALAKDKGIGYQTLLGYIIHGYVAGNLVDVEEVRKVIPGLKIKAG